MTQTEDILLTTASALSSNCDVLSIPTKASDVLSDPLQSNTLVSDTSVGLEARFSKVRGV